MFTKIEKVDALNLAKRGIFLGLCVYCMVVTVVALKMRPQTLLIGLDSYGARVIREASDPVLRKEKENFIKQFLIQLYTFDGESFERRVSVCGDLMTKDLWLKKKPEFAGIAAKLKTDPLVQVLEIQELREVDTNTYQADIKIQVQRKLEINTVKLRVDIRISPSERRETNPYLFEVKDYDENQTS